MARRIKTWLRSTMLQIRFSGLTILHFHKQITDNLHFTAVADEFVSKHDTRRLIFRRFPTTDHDKQSHPNIDLILQSVINCFRQESTKSR